MMKHIRLYLILLVLLFSSSPTDGQSIFTGDFTVYNSMKLASNLQLSLIESRQLKPSPFTTIADCSFACITVPECRTAVYSELSKICSMYRSNGALQGSLSPATSDLFTIIPNSRIPTPPIINLGNISVAGIWNTSIGGDSEYAYSGEGSGSYWPSKPPNNALDGNYNTLYCNHGPCTVGGGLYDTCGVRTGFFFTYPWGPLVLKAFRMVTGMTGERDPTAISIEGSNHNSSMLDRGSSWTLLFNGSAGLDIDPGRQRPGQYQNIQNNVKAFSSYRILTMRKRAVEICAEYADIQLYAL